MNQGRGSDRRPLPALPTIRTPTGSPCVRTACTACCHDTEMLLTKDDVARLTAGGADPAGWWNAPDGYIQLSLRDGPALPGMTGSPCWFLGTDGACTVYAHRPEGCRLYPAVYDGAVVLDDEECPHTDGFALDAQAEAAVAHLVARLNTERDARIRGDSKRS